jgi:hypothetical protein
MEHKSSCDSYDGEAEDISVDDSGNDTFTSEAKITDSDSNGSVDTQALQWVEMKNSGLPHNTKNLSTALDDLG